MARPAGAVSFRRQNETSTGAGLRPDGQLGCQKLNSMEDFSWAGRGAGLEGNTCPHALGASPRRRPRCDRRGAGGVGRRPSGLHRSHVLCNSAVLSFQLGSAVATVAGLGFAGAPGKRPLPAGPSPERRAASKTTAHPKPPSRGALAGSVGRLASRTIGRGPGPAAAALRRGRARMPPNQLADPLKSLGTKT